MCYNSQVIEKQFLSKVEIKEKYPNLIKSVYKKTKASIILSGERMNTFPYDPGIAHVGIYSREMKAACECS